MPIRGGHSSLPFFHGSRACWLFFCCAAEMFFSSLFILLLLLLFVLKSTYTRFWAAKLLISFEIPKNYATFRQKFYVFFYFFLTFGVKNTEDTASRHKKE